MAHQLKKAFSTFVSLTTIAWSVGLGAAPLAASAAMLSTGDLIKASGPAVYYYAVDGKRYVFPNEKAYFSWYSDFSMVKTISDSELAAIDIGGNVTVRPGTKLIKIQTDPKVYAVGKCGQLHWVESEAIAKALYGDAWATRVIDVLDSLFVNYSVGSSIASNVHPDGQLVMYSGDSNYYVIWDGVKRKFASEGALLANMMRKSDAVMTSVSYGNGSDVTGRESALADTVCTTVSAPVGGNVSASLASDTPASRTVTKNASSVPLIKVNLMGGSADATVTGLRFVRTGVGNTSDFSNVYLYNGDGVRLTTGRTINSQTNVVEFNSLNLMVKAGQNMAVYIYGDFAVTTPTGGQHAFRLLDAASVVLSGSGTVSGPFPITGNVFTVGTESSGRLDVQKGLQPANPTIGAKATEISNFKLTANTNDIEVSQVTLYQAGSITNSDLTNFELYQGSTKVASAAMVQSNGRIVLKFATPYLIQNGTTKVFSLKADVAGRASRTIKTYVEYTTDVTAQDKKFLAGAAVCIASTATGGCTATSQGSFDGSSTNYIEVTTQGGTLTNTFNGPATQNIAKGQLAVPLYRFALTSQENALEIRNMTVTLARTVTGCAIVGASGTKYFRSIKIRNKDTGVTVMGPKELTAGTSVTSEALTFTDTFNINPGQTLNLEVVADLSNTGDSGDTTSFTGGTCSYTASLSAFGSTDVRVVDTGEFLATNKIVPNAAVTGNTLTVKSSSLDIQLASTPVSGTLVKKQSNAPLAAMTLTASAQSDVTVTALTLTGQANLATSGCNSNAFGGAACNKENFAQRVVGLSLWDGATMVGTARAPETSGSSAGTAVINNMNLLIPKGTTKTLTIAGTLGSTASTTSPFDKVAVGIASTGDVQAQDQDSNTVTPSLGTSLSNQSSNASPSVVQTIKNSGTLTVQADSHPVSTLVVAGKDAWVPFARYKATAQDESIDLDRIMVLASSTAGTTGDNANISGVAIAVGGAVKGQDVFSSGSTGTKDVDLQNSKISVPKDNSVQFELWVKLANVQPSSTVSGATSGVARSGAALAVGLNASSTSGEWDSNYIDKLNIRAIGAASGERVYATRGAAHGNTMVARKTVPVVTKQSLSSTTLANIDQDLLKFQVAADSQGSVALKQVVFSFSKSSLVALSNFRMRRGSTDLNIDNYAFTNGTSTTDLKTGTIAAGVNSGYIVFAMKAGQEEVITGSGYTYTVHATVSGAASGQNVTMQFLQDSSNAIVTGYLTSTVAFGVFGSSADVFHINTAAAPGSAGSATGTFVWSDNSEVPHSQALGTAGGSRDWSNDVYVQDLSQSQTISL